MVCLRSRLLLFLFVCGTSLLLPEHVCAQETPLIQANRYFQRGGYAKALEFYRKTKDQDRIAGIVGASRSLAMMGQYEQAEAISRQSLEASEPHAAIATELAEVLISTGRSDEALQILEKVVSAPQPPIRSQVQYGKLLKLRGRRQQAYHYFEKAIDQYNESLVFEGEAIAMVAVAAWELESYHDANRLFREAAQVDPHNHEVQALWGELFLQKYNEKEAQKSFGIVLQRNRYYVPALVGIAKLLHGSNAKAALADALAVNEYSIPALLVLAEIALEDGQYNEALGLLNKILLINPESLKAHLLEAAIVYLKDNEKDFVRIRTEVERFSPGNGAFYADIAEILGRKYLFKEAVALARLAIQVDPEYWNGYTILGTNLLRIGQEEEGRIHLEYSFKKDPFNVLTENMLNVLDLLAEFETRQNENFIVRMHHSEADLLWPYLQPLLNEAWDRLTHKYRFTPEGPVLIEIFHKNEDFAVRTIGLPYIGPLLAVCFGNVITMSSPVTLKAGNLANWKEILWHELVHVITLQMTNNRLPRWLSEGISVYEEHQGRPEWGREQEMDLVRAIEENRLFNLKKLNEGFSKAKSSEDLNFAYYQSSLVVEYIVETYRFEALLSLLQQYSSYQPMETIFQTVFQQPLDSFEELFFRWAEARAKELDVFVYRDDPNDQLTGHGHGIRRNSFSSQSERPDREAIMEVMRSRIKAQPRDFLAHFQLGILLYQSESYDEAIEHLILAQKLLPQYSGVPSPHQILAAIYQIQGNKEARLRELKKWVAFQQLAFQASYELAQAAYQDKNHDLATYYLERALDVNPYDEDVHKMLAEISLGQGDFPSAIREYQILVILDKTDPARAHTDLAKVFLKGGKKAEAKKTVLVALEIAPTYEPAQNILLESLEP